MVVFPRIGNQSAIHFFTCSPVFTHDEFVAARPSARSRQTAHNILAHHLQSGRLVRVRRGLYATVPAGVDAATASIDPYLVATKLAPDATVAWHAALQFHGKSHSLGSRYPYLTRHRTRSLHFRGATFVAVPLPAAVRALPDAGRGIVEHRHAGGVARVTTLERTLVDVMDNPRHGGGWEEIWLSLESVEFFDLAEVVRYALLLRSALTVARVGFFLEQHRDALMVEDHHLEALAAHAPRQPRYLDSKRTSGKLVPRWNLVVPAQVLARAWEEER